jgi:EAL domain-containing protein (putative c-di-GMP-specific phosphodiesterase class I)
MYAAKSSGKSTWCCYTPSMQQAALSRLALQRELRQAFRMNEFTLFYQPIVDLHSGAVQKAEALMRWQHPTRGIVPPTEFIRVMEDNGLIVDAGNVAFREAARQVAAWRSVINPQFQITVNKSPVQFRNEESGSGWVNYLEALGLPGNAIAVEITEGMLLEPTPAACRILEDFQRAGIQVALDDFGTGYSSLAYLRKFDIDYVKIDRAFVATIDDPEGAALCRAIIAMAHSLGLKVVAEGVEEDYQLRTLRQMGCDYGQGYLFSRPVPAEQFVAVVNGLLNHNWIASSTTTSGTQKTMSDAAPVQQRNMPVV